jgi:hypothetical protein
MKKAEFRSQNSGERRVRTEARRQNSGVSIQKPASSRRKLKEG